MKYNSRILSLGLSLVIKSYAAGNQHEADRLVTFSDSTLTQVLAKGGLSDANIRGESRNSQGTKLFVECGGKTNGSTIFATISSSGVKIDQMKGISVIPDDEGRVVCSSVDHILVFPGGESMPLQPLARYGFTPGAKCFFVQYSDKEGSIFLTEDREKPLASLEPGFLPQNIFEHEDQIFIFGHGAGPKSSKDAKGFLLSKIDGKFQVVQTIDLSWASGVIDMDVNTGMLLVEGLRDFLPPWELYSIKTGKRTSLGVGNYHGFFLDPSLRSMFGK